MHQTWKTSSKFIFQCQPINVIRVAANIFTQYQQANPPLPNTKKTSPVQHQMAPFETSRLETEF